MSKVSHNGKQQLVSSLDNELLMGNNSKAVNGKIIGQSL